MSITKSFLLNCYYCAVSSLELNVLLYSLTAPCLLLSKVEDFDELIEGLVSYKVKQVFNDILLALLCALLCTHLVSALRSYNR